MENKNENKNSHVILLTVVALITMIVVVIGATFAYLASSIANEGAANVNATTSGGSDLFLINVGDDISITADSTNFKENDGNLTSSTTAEVVLSTSSTDGTEYKYSIKLADISNNFVYSSGTCNSKGTSTTDVTSTQGTYDECRLNGNNWATEDGTTYKCLTNLTEVSGTKYNNQLSCLGSKKVWAMYQNAELIFDLYRKNDYSDELSCDTMGGTWIDEMNGCYNRVAREDITEAPSNTDIVLAENQTITAQAPDSASTTHSYYGILTLVNLGHNQIANSNKSFIATLEVTREIVTD